MEIVLPALPGYSVRAGTDMMPGLSYACPDSLLAHSCLLQGSVEVRRRRRLSTARLWPAACL